MLCGPWSGCERHRAPSRLRRLRPSPPCVETPRDPRHPVGVERAEGQPRGSGRHLPAGIGRRRRAHGPPQGPVGGCGGAAPAPSGPRVVARLTEIRRNQPDAGGLVIAIDHRPVRPVARAAARRLVGRFRSIDRSSWSWGRRRLLRLWTMAPASCVARQRTGCGVLDERRGGEGHRSGVRVELRPGQPGVEPSGRDPPRDRGGRVAAARAVACRPALAVAAWALTDPGHARHQEPPLRLMRLRASRGPATSATRAAPTRAGSFRMAGTTCRSTTWATRVP